MVSKRVVFGAVDLRDGVAFKDGHALGTVAGMQGDRGAAFKEGLPGKEDLGADGFAGQRDGAGAATAVAHSAPDLSPVQQGAAGVS
ncbi:hypothetical protein [Streptomyces sp. AC558_RSS880]|uniref:hypothetical protein n=1 Tax=Streptomyces sp. AC558_RSS880 TaxID=2823687 RepID=UPI0020B63EC0|nr:hypothetical protein [Streptomyces sp. AC558_RSS880]